MSDFHDGDYEDWSLFTGRPAKPLDRDAVRASVAGKRILVTGAGGFIGSAFTRALAKADPAELVLLDVGEQGLHQLNCDLQRADVRLPTPLVVGSVRDPALIIEVFNRHQPQVVVHAAACKHVPLMERNPFTAASTNVLGTQLIAETAMASGAEQCLLLSTDKAVDPGSIMGATKRIAELILLAQRTATQMKALRLGNVLGSSGSVVPLFLDQISRGGPVTVTDPEATRYFLSVNEAVQHLLSALAIAASPSLLVPDVGEPHGIYDLAKFLIAKCSRIPSGVEIVFTGLRSGDKLVERMSSPREHLAPRAEIGLHMVQTSIPPLVEVSRCLDEVEAAVSKRDLNDLLRAIQIVVPEYRPRELLRHYLDETRELRSA